MPGFVLRASDLDRVIRFERKIAATGLKSAGREEWEPVATVAAQVQDMLPSRGERLVEGANIAARPSRVRIRYRQDINSDMRIVYGARIMQILSPPAELGRRVALEMIAQDYSTAGGQP